MRKIQKTFFILMTLALAIKAHAHSDAIKPAYVDSLLVPYFGMQKALAADDLSTTQSHAKHFLMQLEKGPKEAKSIGKLKGIVGKIRDAKDIKAARTEFQPLSKDMTLMVKHLGTSGKADVYELYCPMAFGNKGAGWLQSDKDTANPYFGASMLKCGSVKKHLAKGHGNHAGHGDKHSEHSDHSGHSH